MHIYGRLVYTNDKTIILEDNIVEFNYVKDEVVCRNPLRERYIETK